MTQKRKDLARLNNQQDVAINEAKVELRVATGGSGKRRFWRKLRFGGKSCGRALK